MTENEAIEIIKNHCKNCKDNIGIECIASEQEGKCWEVKHRAIMSMRKIQEYQKIGTVEECLEARERQRGKKVNNRTLLRDLNGNSYTVRGDCPNCGSVNLVSTNTDYCNACGQKLDWSDSP